MQVARFSTARAADGDVVATTAPIKEVNFSGRTSGIDPSEFTVGGWIQIREPSAVVNIFAAGLLFVISLDQTRHVTAGFIGGGSVTADVAIDDDHWHFLACDFSPATDSEGFLDLYLDGSRVATGLVQGAVAAAGGGEDWLIGQLSKGLDVGSWCIWSKHLQTEELDVPIWGQPTAGLPESDALEAAFDFLRGAAVDVGPHGRPVRASSLVWHTPCRKFDAGALVTADSSMRPGGPDQFSVLMWMHADVGAASTSGTPAPLFLNGTVGGTFLSLGTDGHQLLVGWVLDGQRSLSRIAALSKGDWNHIAVTFDGSVLSTFVNGEEVGTDRVPAGTFAPPSEWGTPSFGVTPRGEYARGVYLQNSSVWTRQLSVDEIRKFGGEESPMGDKTCAGFYPFSDPEQPANAMTLVPAVADGSTSHVLLETPVTAADADAVAAKTPRAAPADEIMLVTWSALRRRARQAQLDGSLTGAGRSLHTQVAASYDQLLLGLSAPLADRLRADFRQNLEVGLVFAATGDRLGSFELENQENETVIYYHAEVGRTEVGRIDLVVDPWITWGITIFLDAVGLIASMFGIATTAAKVAQVESIFGGLAEKVKTIALSVLGMQGGEAGRAGTLIARVLGLLWEYKAIGPLIRHLLIGSWWSVAFTTLSIVTTIAGMILTGGALIALKVAQMAIALAQLIKDLLARPESDGSQARTPALAVSQRGPAGVPRAAAVRPYPVGA